MTIHRLVTNRLRARRSLVAGVSVRERVRESVVYRKAIAMQSAPAPTAPALPFQKGLRPGLASCTRSFWSWIMLAARIFHGRRGVQSRRSSIQLSVRLQPTMGCSGGLGNQIAAPRSADMTGLVNRECAGWVRCERHLSKSSTGGRPLLLLLGRRFGSVRNSAGLLRRVRQSRWSRSRPPRPGAR